MTASESDRILRMGLRPLQTDPKDLGVEHGVRIWGAYSCDPAFIATPPAGEAPLEPGWYRASAVLDCRSGDIDEPRLYVPDAAGSYSQPHSIEMLRDGVGYGAQFYLPHTVRELRLDPSRYPCEFACDALELTRLPRAPGLGARWSVFRPRIPGAAMLGRWRDGARRLLRRIDSIGQPPLPANRRKERVLASIDRNGVGIEIGPSHDPIAPKREGFNVHIIDHASREELLWKYHEHPIASDRIEEVDFIWKGQSYADLVGKTTHYDWVIASHLIEHTPDLIAFLRDCESLLKDDGVLSLVIPDKRFTFDRFRPITGLARVIDSHFAGNKIHSAGACAEYFMNVAGKDHKLSWDARARGDYVFLHSAQYARSMIPEVREKGSYLDIHNWCFVPHSFRLLVNDLYTLGFTNLREVTFEADEGWEFYVALGRHGKGPDKSRLELLRAIDAELAASEPSARGFWGRLAGH